MTTIAIVQCGAAKRDVTSRACDLYIGSLFRILRAAAERIADRWYIASAKHGLVHPSRVLRPYNVTLPHGGSFEWGSEVFRTLREREPGGWSRLVALCSARYLVGWASELGAETPLQGLSIGRMQAAAKRIR